MTRYKKVLKLSVIMLLAGALLGCEKGYDKPAQRIETFHFRSATELISAIRSGEISSVDLLNLYLERIQRYNGDINAVVALDIEAAQARAAAADKALAMGQNWGPLHGLPMTVKDVFEVVGMPATSGDPGLKNHIPKSNAIAVQRLVDSGAIIFGKTNVPYHASDIQSYNDIYGTTNNPWDLSRTPGGSSGGSAAALAAGLTPLELGSDIGGSIRLPAGYNGIFGHKPTFGIVPRYGHIPPMPGQLTQGAMPIIPLFVVGPLARSADDLALALDVLTTSGSEKRNGGRSDLLPARREQFRDYRVAVWFTDADPEAEIDADVLATLQRTVRRLRDAGLFVDEQARPQVTLKRSAEIWYKIYTEMQMRALPLNETFVAEQKREQAMWAEFFKDYDVLLTPVSPTVAFAHNHEGPLSELSLAVNGKLKPMINSIVWSYMAIVSGLPATVAPAGRNDSGLPVGIQIIGARFEDRTTIDFARGLSELTGGFVAPPGYKD